MTKSAITYLLTQYYELYSNLMKQILDIGLDSDLQVFVSNLIPSLHVKEREREKCKGKTDGADN